MVGELCFSRCEVLALTFELFSDFAFVVHKRNELIHSLVELSVTSDARGHNRNGEVICCNCW